MHLFVILDEREITDDYVQGARFYGLYSCDHPVTQDEWRQHFDAFHKESGERYKAYQERWPDHIWFFKNDPEKDAAYRAYSQWREDNDPVKTFIKKHGLTPLEYTGLTTTGGP